MTAGRVLAVIVLAAVILFPGVELIRFVFSDVLGLYKEMTLTDCLLFFVVVLLCALLLQRRSEEPRLRAVGPKVEEKRPRSASRAPRTAPDRGTRPRV